MSFDLSVITVFETSHTPNIAPTQWHNFTGAVQHPEQARPKRYRFTYRGLLRCGACGLSVTAEHKTNRHGSCYVYYHCTRKHRTWRCNQPSLEGRALHEQVRALLKRLYTPAKLHEWATRRLEKNAAKFEASAANRIQQLQRTIDETESQLSNLTDLRIRGLIDDAEFDAKRKNLRPTIDQLKARISSLDHPTDMFEPQQSLLKFANRAISWFDVGCDEVKRRIIKTVCSNPTLTDKIVSLEARKPFRFSADLPVYPLLRADANNAPTIAPVLEHHDDRITDVGELRKHKRRISAMMRDAIEMRDEPEIQDMVTAIKWLEEHCESGCSCEQLH